jgi:hypothetical protein
MNRKTCGARRSQHSNLRLASAFAIATLVATLGTSLTAQAQSSIGEPLASGDQLLFFFDSRSPRVSFVSVSNPANEPVTIEILIPSAGLRESIQLDARGNQVIDPTALAPEQRGLLVLTPIVDSEDHTPVVPPQPILGSYTIANLLLGAAFGGNALGRRAVEGGSLATPGSIVDGSTVRYQVVNPEALAVPVYFDPQTVGPPEQDGNRLRLAAFRDEYDGGEYDLAPLLGSVEAQFFDNGGTEVADRTAPLANGLLDIDLEALAGTELTSSGKVFLTFLPDGTTGNFIGLFSQALGTFGAGGVLPEVELSSGS